MTKRTLPEDLEQEVLLRLPFKSLERFSSVCKRWHSYLQNPLFIKRYNALPPRRQALICFRRDHATKTNVVSLHDRQTFEKIEDLEFPPFPVDGLERDGDEEFYDACLKDYVFHRDVHVLGPINGYYCIYHRLIERCAGTLVLWNPDTRDYKYIRPAISYPIPARCLRGPCRFIDGTYNNGAAILSDDCLVISDPESFQIGFGFDHNLMTYKVVVICYWTCVFNPAPLCWHVRVYNSVTDSWRVIYSYPTRYGSWPIFSQIQMDSRPEFTNCYLNQVYHWSCRKEGGTLRSTLCVLAFDMVKETFKLLAGPPISATDYVRRSVWVCQEALVMVACSAKTESVEVWKMNEYGVAESWTMQYSIRVGPINGFRVVGISNDGRVFFSDNNAQLVSYSPDDDCKIKEHGIHGMYEAVGGHISDGIDEYPRTYYGLGCGELYGTLGVVNYVECLGELKPLGNNPQLCDIERNSEAAASSSVAFDDKTHVHSSVRKYLLDIWDDDDDHCWGVTVPDRELLSEDEDD